MIMQCVYKEMVRKADLMSVLARKQPGPSRLIINARIKCTDVKSGGIPALTDEPCGCDQGGCSTFLV